MYGNFIEGVNFAYWWSSIGKGLRLKPLQQACFIIEMILTFPSKFVDAILLDNPYACMHGTCLSYTV